jgi:hypothetical protein
MPASSSSGHIIDIGLQQGTRLKFKNHHQMKGCYSQTQSGEEAVEAVQAPIIGIEVLYERLFPLLLWKIFLAAVVVE